MKKKNYIILFLVLLIGFVYIYFFDDLNIKIPCLFHKLTGLYCPGCGITRLFVNLVHFRIKKAFYCNQLVFCLIPFFIIYCIDYIFLKIQGKGFIKNKTKKDFLWLFLIITILFGIIRNIPYFSILRP